MSEENKIGDEIKPNRGRGRPKGAVNKTTASAKAVIEEAANGLGGAARLLEWAQEDQANEKAFWSSIYPKLLPLQVNGEMNIAGEFTVKQILVNGVKVGGYAGH